MHTRKKLTLIDLMTSEGNGNGRKASGRCLYFAFGSNLNIAQMRRRCPSARLASFAVLEGYRLSFTGRSASWGGGVATVIFDDETRTPGVLFSISMDDLVALDAYEGFPFTYLRIKVRVRDDRGRFRSAWTYKHRSTREVWPSSRYLGVIHDAYKFFGFDTTDLVCSLPMHDRFDADEVM